MDLSKLPRILLALLVGVITTGFIWMVLGAIGYNRVGAFGVKVAAFPAIIIGVIVFFLVFRIIDALYSKNNSVSSK